MHRKPNVFCSVCRVKRKEKEESMNVMGKKLGVGMFFLFEKREKTGIDRVVERRDCRSVVN